MGRRGRGDRPAVCVPLSVSAGLWVDVSALLDIGTSNWTLVSLNKKEGRLSDLLTHTPHLRVHPCFTGWERGPRGPGQSVQGRAGGRPLTAQVSGHTTCWEAPVALWMGGQKGGLQPGTAAHCGGIQWGKGPAGDARQPLATRLKMSSGSSASDSLGVRVQPSFKGSPLGPSAAALSTVTTSPPPWRGWGLTGTCSFEHQSSPSHRV